MSGGSYNYICFKDADEILNSASEVEAMADRLSQLGYAEDAAAETEEILTIMRQYERRANVRLQRLSAVWHAVEWWDSADSGEDDVKDALAKYRGESDQA